MALKKASLTSLPSSSRFLLPLSGGHHRCFSNPALRAGGHTRLAMKAAQAGQVDLTLSPNMLKKVTANLLEGIDLIVYDMAGTTVEEGGTVYKTLQQAMNEDGLDVSNELMHPWHGAKKEKVIEHFVRQAHGATTDSELEERIMRISEKFIVMINEAYYGNPNTVRLINDDLFTYFRRLQNAGVKVALDTGYPQDIQLGLLKHLNLDLVVDGYISSYEVREGRPYPYMIHQLMERMGIQSVKRVAKVGDSIRDIEEGVNAGCGLIVGVLSGADSAEDLMEAGADVIATNVTDLGVPRKRMNVTPFKLPDLS